MITYIARKRTPAAFSIEKQFDALCSYFRKAGVQLNRLELPYVSTGIVSVIRNILFVALGRRTRMLHIVGDVHYAALFCLFSRTIITVHDCVVLQRGTGFKRFVMRTLWFSLPMRLASAVTVISEQTKRELLATVPVRLSKIHIIPVPLDPAFQYSERPFEKDKPRILHVGTTKNKNLSRVIAALRNIQCTLIVVGPIPAETHKELKKSDIEFENFIGLDHAAVRRLYEGADIVSFPSTYEGFGMPITEGQATGRPVLTSDLEPMRSVAGPDGALLVDPESVDSIREGFLTLIREADIRTRLVAAGRKNSSRFALEAVAAQYLDVYRRVGAEDHPQLKYREAAK